MTAKYRDIGTSVRARLLQRARDEQTDFQLLLTRFVLERLLYRLSVSPYRDHFVLKGALLLAAWAGDRFRPTRDLDLLAYGDASPAALTNVFRTICSELVPEDGVTFDAEALQAGQIREDTEYGGVRIRTTATVSNTFTLKHRSLKEALRRTFKRRGTPFPDRTPVGLTQDFAAAWQARWRGFIGRERMIPVPDEFTAVIAKLNDFVMPVLHGFEQDLLWQPSGPWSPKQAGSGTQ